MSFDGSAYRRSVLATLRDRSPSEVEDLFWLAEVPRDADDDAAVAEMLKATRGFLFKERTRARQAAVASAVLNEWPRIEATLLDPAARAALRRRLEASGSAAPVVALSRPKPAGDRRRRQVGAALAELARLRDDPHLAEDLFAFLGLPTSTTRDMISGRIQQIADVNRRRRPDRERTLVDELLAHARKLLLDGDPAEYLAGDVVDALVAGDLDAARAARARGVPDSAIVAAARRVPGPVPLDALGLAEAHALAEVDALLPSEREARLRELLERNPGWRLVAGRLATLPPAPPRT